LDIGVTSFHDIHDWALKNLRINPVFLLFIQDNDLHKRSIPGFQDILKLTQHDNSTEEVIGEI
jgi:hypothetical protein